MSRSWKLSTAALFVSGLLLVVLLAGGASKLWVNGSYKIFFDSTNPQRLAFEELEREFTPTDSVAFVVAPKGGDAFSSSSYQLLETLTERAWSLPYATRVDSLVNFQHATSVEDDLSVGELAKRAADGRAVFDNEARAAALSDPLVVHRLVSSEGHVAAVNVRFLLPPHPKEVQQANKDVMAEVFKLRDEVIAAYPGTTIHLVGQLVTNYNFTAIAESDSGQFMPLMLGLVALVTMILLRSWVAVVIVLFVVLASIVATMGLAGWMGHQLNQVNAIVPTVILTLAVSDAMHIMVRYLDKLHEVPNKHDAMIATLREQWWPVFMTSITVSIGFFTLVSSDSPPFREMGVLVGCGILVTFVITMLVVPPLATWLPAQPRRVLGGRINFANAANAVLRKRKMWFWGSLLFASIWLALIPQNQLNDDTVHYFGKDLEIRQAFDFTDRELNGVYTLEYLLGSGGADGIHDPEYLKQVDAFANWMREQHNVTSVVSYADIAKKLNRVLNGDDPAFYRTPATREEAAQYHLSYELSLPQGQDLTDMVNADKSSSRMIVNIKDITSEDLLRLEDEAAAWLGSNAPAILAKPASLHLMFSHIGRSNISSLVYGAVGGVLLIFVAMALMFRSIKFAVVAVIANTLPAAIAFGMWAVLNGQVNLAVAAVFNVSSGIVIDDTIHLLTNYLRARRGLGLSPEKAIERTYGSVGVILLANTLILTCGFAVFAGSDFSVNSSLGVMTALIIFLAAVYDLILLPSLLLMAERVGAKRQPVEAVAA